MATAAIGEAAAQDMLELSGESRKSIKTVYVKFKDGPPMAAGVRRVFQNADIKYIYHKKSKPILPIDPSCLFSVKMNQK